MSNLFSGLLGGAGFISGAGQAQSQQSAALGGQLQSGISGGYYWGGMQPVTPPIDFVPMYPIMVKHHASGRKLVIWEE